MKNLGIALIVSCFTATAFAQSTNGQSPEAKATSKASIEWTSGTSHNFGKIPQNQPATATFEFTNTGSEPVTITKAQPSCSCTVPDYSKEPILPGKKGFVKATYNAHNPGAFNKTITISTNPGSENFILKITGEVLPKQDQAAPKQ